MIFITYLTLITSLMVYPYIILMFEKKQSLEKKIKLDLEVARYNKVDVK